MLSSDMYYDEDISSENSANENNLGSSGSSNRRKRSKKTARVKYWTLPTMSSGTFDPNMLTERQQLQYLKSKGASSGNGANEDMLEYSPLRLDRIKLEEMRSMKGGSNTNTHPTGHTTGTDVSTEMSLFGSSPIPPNRRVKESSKLKKEILELSEASEIDEQEIDHRSKTRDIDDCGGEDFVGAGAGVGVVNDENITSSDFNNEKTVKIIKPSSLSELKQKKQKTHKKQKVVEKEGASVLDNTSTILETTNCEAETETLTLNELDSNVTTSNIIDDHSPQILSKMTPVTTTTIAQGVDDISTTPSRTFLGVLSSKVQNFITYSDSIRQKHLSAFLSSMAVRKGISVDSEEMVNKRKEIERKEKKNSMI